MMTERHAATRCSRGLLTTAGLALGVAACQPDDSHEVTIIGERAIVTFERPLCRGNIAAIEETISHAEERLDVRVDEPIEIFLWSRYSDVVARCSEGPSGCYIDGEIHTLWQSLEHEIVHAVADPLGDPEPLWSEGIAEALSSRTRDGEADVGSLVGLESYRQVDYGTAGHFTRWLLEERGVEGVRLLARDASFEQAYGVPLVDAVEDYEASGPWSYPRPNPCRGERLEATAEGEWVYDIAGDCDDPWASAEYQSGPTILRTLDVTDPGRYELLVTGAKMISAVVCQLDTLVEQPDDDMAGDIVSETAGTVLPGFVGGETYEIELEPGRLQFEITVDGAGTTAGFELRRTE